MGRERGRLDRAWPLRHPLPKTARTFPSLCFLLSATAPSLIWSFLIRKAPLWLFLPLLLQAWLVLMLTHCYPPRYIPVLNALSQATMD